MYRTNYFNKLFFHRRTIKKRKKFNVRFPTNVFHMEQRSEICNNLIILCDFTCRYMCIKMCDCTKKERILFREHICTYFNEWNATMYKHVCSRKLILTWFLFCPCASDSEVLPNWCLRKRGLLFNYKKAGPNHHTVR